MFSPMKKGPAMSRAFCLSRVGYSWEPIRQKEGKAGIRKNLRQV
jgi:hypothetical protein